MPPPGGPKPAISKRVRYYAVRRGRDGFRGILDNWEQARRLVNGVSNASCKSFNTMEGAQDFIDKSPAVPPANVSRCNTRASASATNATASSPQTPKPPMNATVPASPVHELYAGTSAAKLARDAPDPSDESPKQLTVYTDGACSKNGRAGAKAGYAVYFGEENPYNVSEPLPETPTNQRAEMTAVLEAMRITLDHGLVANKGKLVICTDSQVCLLLSIRSV